MTGTFTWQVAEPEALGDLGARLGAVQRRLESRGRTKALLVVHRDRIVCEWYAPDCGPTVPHYTASLAKALVGGMTLVLALNDGRLAVDDPAWTYIPRWRGHAEKSRITLRHLATHTSGIEDAEEAGKSHEELDGWKGAFWRREPDPFTVALDQAPVLFPPGSQCAYSNPGMAALAYAVAASLKGAPQEDLLSLLAARVMDPIGVPRAEWSIGYGQSYEVDGLRLYASWGGAAFTARATARVGRLMLRRGNWEGRQLIAPGWVDTAVTYAGMPTSTGPNTATRESGLGWWTNSHGLWPGLPRDAFAGAGAGHQVLLVVPSLDLIVVRYGEDLGDEKEGNWWRPLEEQVLDPIVEAVMHGEPPVPPSPVIQRVTFAPESTIVRAAVDSDNWPITWADDGEQYTSYGDGWGFDPRTERKLSQGFAKVSGGPEDFRGVNIRTATGEREGDGAAGAKASGLLMVGGVLYLLVRNVGNSQVAWSGDHGHTWEWGFRFQTSFGCPSFLNFGRNYEGARDEYVYVYSSDGPTAYECYDQVVLARIPRTRIADREAYEFFAGLTPEGDPQWVKDIDGRQPVLGYPKHCARLDVVYDPGLRRYLMALGYNQVGGWGLFDAAEPWGPWTAAFHTEDWGLGDTHGYRLPSKWIAPDGRTLHLVFSGRTHRDVVYDAFCVRRLTLELAPP
jgi:CubicO group peptidase (beta-lactamase class C family)